VRFRIPDWAIYFLIVFLFYINAAKITPNLEGSVPPPDLGPMMPSESPRDTTVLVEMTAPTSGIGTAFAVDKSGTWLMVRGRYRTEEAILAWTEVGRTRGLRGSLGGMSGGPVLDVDGEVIGIVAAESPRRGRIYSVAPRSLKDVLPSIITAGAKPISDDSYGLEADKLRRERRIAQVICVVN